MWKQPMPHEEGWAWLEKKITACTYEINQWQANNFGPQKGNTKLMREELARLRGREGAADTWAIKKLKEDIQAQLEKEDLWWR
jgi:hypothetical protein